MTEIEAKVEGILYGIYLQEPAIKEISLYLSEADKKEFENTIKHYKNTTTYETLGYIPKGLETIDMYYYMGFKVYIKRAFSTSETPAKIETSFAVYNSNMGIRVFMLN